MNPQWQSLDRTQADLQALRVAIADQRRQWEALLARHRLQPETLYQAYQRATPEEQRLVQEQLARSVAWPRPASF